MCTKVPNTVCIIAQKNSSLANTPEPKVQQINNISFKYTAPSMQGCQQLYYPLVFVR